MSEDELAEYVEAAAEKFGMPGVAVGVWARGRERYVCRGVTSIDNPLPIDQDTLFVVGSVTKTFTATALLRLVEQGRVDTTAPVRRYLPEFRLKDEDAAAEITVAQLLNHTSGLDWGVTVDTGEGDDALARYVSLLSDTELVGRPGERVSYSQAGYNVLGRVIERVTDSTYEHAVASLVLEPLGLAHSFFHRDDVMTRRFAVGHNRDDGGTMSVARLWRRWRGENPGGGLVSSIADQLRWARFHLGDGRSATGEQLLTTQTLDRMRRPTARLRASSLGDAIGICWFLRDVEGVHAVGHGGSASGQFAELLLVPQHDFAVVSVCNAGPDGVPFNQAVVRWALETYLGVREREPEPLPYDEARAAEVVGRYENEVMTLTIDTVPGGLRAAALMRPEIRAAADKDLPPDYPPAGLGLLPGDGDEYILTDGGLKGLRGYFARDDTGAVVGVDMAGRLFTREHADGQPA